MLTQKNIQAIVLIILLTAFGTKVKAQNEIGQTDISIGLGGSLIGVYFSSENFAPGAESEVSGVFSVTAETAFHKNFSVGLSVSHQQLRLNYTDYQWYNEDDSVFVVSTFYEGLNRTNIAIRALWHFNLGAFNPRFDPYLGLRSGYSLWRYNHNSPDPDWQELDLKRNWLSYQIVLGAKAYFTDHFGVHFELGLGSPYLIDVGLNYKFGGTSPE